MGFIDWLSSKKQTPDKPDTSNPCNTDKVSPCVSRFYVAWMVILSAALAAAIIWRYSLLHFNPNAGNDASKKAAKIVQVLSTSGDGFATLTDSTLAQLSGTSPAVLKFAKKYQENDSTKAGRYRIPTDTLNAFLLQNTIVTATTDNPSFSIILLVALCGALGATIYILQSFANYLGNGTLKKNWLAFYVVKPWIGVGLSLVFYFLMGAHLLLNDDKKVDISNINTVLAIAFLVGLFTDKSMKKLDAVFDTILSPPKDTKDTLNDKKVTVTDISPKTIKLGDPAVPFKITGTGFTAGMVVTCNKNPVISQKVADDSNSITFSYAAVAADGNIICVVISDPAGKIGDINAGSITVTV